MVRNVTQCLEILAVLYCLSCLFGRRMVFSIHAVILIIADLILFTGINEHGFPMYFFSLSYVGLFLYCLFYYDESIKVTLINCFLAVVTIGVLQLVLCLPILYIFGSKSKEMEIDELLINVGSLCIIVLLGNKIGLKEISDFFQRRNKLLSAISVFILICLGERIFQIKKNGFIDTVDGIQILYFILLFFCTINEWQKARMDVERKRTQLEMNRLYYAAYDELLTLVRERQHDLKNHINAIYSMIYTIDNYDELVYRQREYCQYVIDKNEETKILLSSGNPLIAGFLYKKVQEAEKQNIEVEYKISAAESEFTIPEYEIVEIIGILFDNAVEALTKVQEEIKKIYITICTEGNELHISVANSSRVFDSKEIEKFFNQGFSSKGKNRGIGLSKLKRIVHDLAGEIIVSNEKYEDNYFLKFSIILPQNEKRSEITQ